MAQDDSKTLSPVEAIKARSGNLRGTLVESLADGATGAIAEDDTQVSKFHGIYQQDDRDVRADRRRARLEPAYSFMIRLRMPGGIVTPDQWLALSELARTHANGSLRLTTRQAIQYHGVIKTKLKPTMAAINATLLDTLAACGDVNRNVMCSANPVESDPQREAVDWAQRISDHLTPRTTAYHEIWLDRKKVVDTAGATEPVYGDTYLPRKFKTALVIPPYNDTDVYANDLGFIAIVEDGELTGFNVTVGGGMGMTHGDEKTFPRLADVLGYCTTEQVIAVAEAVVTTQRDYGDRTERKHARLKYTIEDRGVDWFRDEVERRSGVAFEPARDVSFVGTGDRYGWLQGDDGRWHLTLFVENGRLRDDGQRLLSGVDAIARVHDGDLRVTGNQNLIVAGVSDDARPAIDAIAREYGLIPETPPSPVRLASMACVAFPTCGLAMAESERYLPDLISTIDGRLAAHGLADTPIVIRMTGCPNGCARPFLAEIGLVGKALGRYNLYLGADATGQRLNRLVLENADEAAILDTLEPLFADYAARREPGEAFGDFVVRTGHVAPVAAGSEFHSVPAQEE